MAILSILTLYDYDDTLFDGMQLPTAADITNDADKVTSPWVPVKQDLVNNICMECAELELVYPSWPVMYKMISIWSKTRLPVWIALYNTLLYKYNPIWNKDGNFREVRLPNLTTTDSGSVTNMATAHTGTITNKVTGYDSNTFANDGQVEYNNTDTVNGASGNTRTETGSDTITRTETGNIGVTMTQEMIERQRDVVQFNLYEVITAEFKSKFCIELY